MHRRYLEIGKKMPKDKPFPAAYLPLPVYHGAGPHNSSAPRVSRAHSSQWPVNHKEHCHCEHSNSFNKYSIIDLKNINY